MYGVAEALGGFSVCRESVVTMAAVNYLKTPILIKPMSQILKKTKFMRWINFSAPTFKCGCSNVEEKSVAGDVFSVTSSSKYDVDYLGESTKGDMNLNLDHLESLGN